VQRGRAADLVVVVIVKVAGDVEALLVEERLAELAKQPHQRRITSRSAPRHTGFAKRFGNPLTKVMC
jgi:hypothetical protein